MVPVSKNLPNVKFGSTQNPIITPGDFCTIFNLIIPPTAFDKTCTLSFLFPNNLQAELPFAFLGPGHFNFTGYATGVGATKDTTYSHQPAPGPSPPPTTLTPGGAYVIFSGPCGFPPGLPEPGVTVSGMLCSADTFFQFHESAQKCPIGFFVTVS
jgi:hypothetical protein